jgi:glycosyltransferase involved in cell wall biosynthesis
MNSIDVPSGANGKGSRPVRVTFLAVMPAPYMMDLFEAIHHDRRFCLTVHFLEKPAVAAPGVYWQEKSLPAYASVLPGGWVWFLRARVHINTGLFAALAKDRPDVVVVLGYSSLTWQLAMYWLSVKRIPWIFWGEVPGFERRGVFGAMLRWSALRPVACLADGIAAIGSRAAAAYAGITRRVRPVWNIPYYCRNDGLVNIERKAEGVNEAAHFLYCGQIVPRKGVDLLVRAFCRLAAEHPGVRLTLVGDGPMRETLTASVPEGIRARVTWAGFKEVEDLPAYFAGANVFVLPSVHDGWGVVINQAVSAGMAVIASDAVGAAVDLVSEHGNGLIFPNQSEEGLTAALRFFAERPECIQRFGAASRAMAPELGPERGAERWYRFCQAILKRRGK